MEINQLYSQLQEAYKEDNLNKLSLELITLQKKKEYGILQQLAEIIAPWEKIEIDKNGKGFTRFMMLYHPDRGDFYRKQIDELYSKKDREGLLEYVHILKIKNIEELTAAMVDYEDIDYSPVYAWDFEESAGFSYNDYDGNTTVNEPGMNPNAYTGGSFEEGLTFYEAVQIRMYGDTNVEFPTYYLADLDEVEMSASEIADLDGVEYCIHAETLDLSYNYISDLSPLWGLSGLRELNISDNLVGYIDALSNLLNLQRVNISNNQIDDLSPLFELEELEYVQLTGNPVSPQQIYQLRERGVAVIV